MKLIQYRDWGMSTYTWFWVTDDDKVVGPYFNSENDANEWMLEQLDNVKAMKDDNPVP